MLSLSLVRNKQTESSEAGMKAQKIKFSTSINMDISPIHQVRVVFSRMQLLHMTKSQERPCLDAAFYLGAGRRDSNPHSAHQCMCCLEQIHLMSWPQFTWVRKKDMAHRVSGPFQLWPSWPLWFPPQETFTTLEGMAQKFVHLRLSGGNTSENWHVPHTYPSLWQHS